MLVATLSLVLPTHLIQAATGDSWLGLPTFEGLMQAFFYWIFVIVGNLTGIAAKALNFAIFTRPGADIPIVTGTWTILRDFSNMIFILLLVYMALATIFDYDSKYKFKDVIVKFVFVAVLINFSLVIGHLIIDFCQVLTNVFLGTIGNVGDRLGTYLNPSLLLPGPDQAGATLISLVFAVILSLIYLFSLLVALVFAVIRTPYIWILLILSPLAWMSHIFPNGEKWWKQWWSNFWGWNLFLPVYLFFMYLGLLFLAQRDTIMSAVVRSQIESGGVNPTGVPLLAGLSTSMTFNLLFFYLFAAFVMIGGLKAAISVTSMMGSGFDKSVGMAKNFVKRLPIVPGVGNLEAAEKAYGARRSEFQQKGFRNPWLNKVYGGTDAQKKANEKASKFAPFRLEVPESKVQKDFVAEVRKQYDDIEDKYDTGGLSITQLKAKIDSTKADSADGYAYRKFAIKKGVLKGDQFRNSLESLKNNPYAVQDFVKTAQDAKFNNLGDIAALGLDTTLATPGLVAARRSMLMHVSDDARSASKLDAAQFASAIRELGTYESPEGKKFFKNAGKFRPDLMINYTLDPANNTGETKTREQLWDGAINTDAKDIVSMPMSVWGESGFHGAMSRKLGPVAGRNNAQKKLRARFEQLFLNDPDGAAKQLALDTHIP